MNTADSIVTVMNIHPNHRMFLSIFCNIRNSFLSFFALDHSPDSRMILIPLTILILFHRFQWQIVVALLLFEDQHRVSPIFHEVLPHSQRIAQFHYAEVTTCGCAGARVCTAQDMVQVRCTAAVSCHDLFVYGALRGVTLAEDTCLPQTNSRLRR